MGVIYKLKKDVIDFIVNRKRDNPALSCRQLVKITEQEFQINLSKSSINVILKQSQLSSPVGRRTVIPSKQKKFKIPEFKKQQLFSPLIEAGDKIETEKTTPEIKKEDVLYDGIGSIFLKAAQWETSEASILGKILKENTNLTDFNRYDEVGETLLFMQVFGIKEIKEISNYKGTGLWIINDINGAYDSEQILKVIEKINNYNLLDINLDIETSQLFTEVTSIDIFLQDGSKIIMDPLLCSFISSNVQSESCGIRTALNSINCIINNVQSVNFFTVNEIDKNILNLYLAFENTSSKRILRISAADKQGTEIVSFDKIYEKKRTLSMGVWPGQEIFEKILKMPFDKNLQKYTNPMTKKGEYFYEVLLPLKEFFPEEISQEIHAKMRSFVLCGEGNQKPDVIIVTNAVPEEKSAEEIISSWIRRWPNKKFLQATSHKEKNNSPTDCVGHQLSTSLTANSCDILLALRQYINKLKYYCYLNYFYRAGNYKEIVDSIYSLAGNIAFSDETITAKLQKAGSLEISTIINKACQAVNQRPIFDFKGRRLYINPT